MSAIEAPSGKDAGYENFPVGSWLLPAALRPHVAVFYAYARAIDDIADSPALTPDDKIARLEGFARAIRGEDTSTPELAKAHAMRRVLATTGIPNRHCLDLIDAFKQDAGQTPLRRLGGTDRLLLQVGGAGRPLPARSARRLAASATLPPTPCAMVCR